MVTRTLRREWKKLSGVTLVEPQNPKRDEQPQPIPFAQLFHMTLESDQRHLDNYNKHKNLHVTEFSM
jgi:hypothetical protein